MEKNKEALDKLCRVCGCGLRKSKMQYSASKYTKLLAVVGIHSTTDNPDVHPAIFCHMCYTTLKRKQVATESGKPFATTLQVYAWLSHTDDSYNTCTRLGEVGRRGKPPRKSTYSGRPPTHKTIKHIQEVAPASCRPTNRDLEYLLPASVATFFTLDDLECSVCHEILDQPIHLPCDHTACAKCLTTQLGEQRKLVCPCCGDKMHELKCITAASTLVLKVLSNLTVCCKTCRRFVKASELETHQCQQGALAPSPADVTLQDLLSKTSTSPLSPLEQQIGSSLIQRMETDGVVEVRKGGQPLVYMRLTRPRKPSTDVSRRTLQRRVQELHQVRERVSMGASSVQLQVEVQSLTKDERQQLLRDAGFSVDIPAEVGLALKADLGLPWRKLRMLRRWLKEWKVSVSSERQQRSVARRLLGDNLVAEAALFSFPHPECGEQLKAAPLVYVPNLTLAVVNMLEEKEKYNQLTWHDGAIPPDEIWIKVGGDKGGSSFKMSFQICNVLSPNAVNNTYVFCVFQAADTPVNLTIALERYCEQINELQEMQWRDKRFRVFHFGDYQYLSIIYGISGASGRHCCLFCTATMESIKTPPQNQSQPPEQRSLATLERDYNSFKSSGGSLKNAKRFNNVIRGALLNISLSQVAVPGLHISLGVFYRLFCLLEDRCHQLDLERAVIPCDSSEGGPSYHRYTQTVQKIAELKSQKEAAEKMITGWAHLNTLLMLTVAEPQLTSLQTEIREEQAKTRREVDQLNKEIETLTGTGTRPFSREEGPFVQALDEALSSFSVQRQAYYGGTFIGNHVHRTLKPTNIETLTNSVVRTARQCCPGLVGKADEIKTRFKEAFTLFARCHSIYDSSEVTPSQINTLEEDIKVFMDYYRTNFPGSSITPKFHMLEVHIVPFLRQWGFGFGFMGEQGGESIHSQFNHLERIYTNIPNMVEKLHRTVQEHHLRVAPSNVAIQPMVKRRKKHEE